jgi:hypothetical protein
VRRRIGGVHVAGILRTPQKDQVRPQGVEAWHHLNPLAPGEKVINNNTDNLHLQAFSEHCCRSSGHKGPPCLVCPWKLRIVATGLGQALKVLVAQNSTSKVSFHGGVQ